MFKCKELEKSGALGFNLDILTVVLTEADGAAIVCVKFCMWGWKGRSGWPWAASFGTIFNRLELTFGCS